MTMLLTFIASHLLTILENLLAQEEPVILDMVDKEARLLINKIEALLNSKIPLSPNAAIVKPAVMVYNVEAQNS